MVKHAETHPDLDVPNCFGCKVANISFSIPAYMSSRSLDGKNGMSGIDQTAAYQRDLNEALKNDTEGRLQRY